VSADTNKPAWPNGPPSVGDRAPVRPGDTITGAVEVLEVRKDKPITKLRTTVTRDDGVVALEGEALCYTVPLAPSS